MRKWRRLIAHNRIKKAGIVQQNKEKYGYPSYFSKHWREYA